MSFVNKRIKQIKLADKEPLGWVFVRHYESDALADSDVEKQIEKASRSRKERGEQAHKDDYDLSPTASDT